MAVAIAERRDVVADEVDRGEVIDGVAVTLPTEGPASRRPPAVGRQGVEGAVEGRVTGHRGGAGRGAEVAGRQALLGPIAGAVGPFAGGEGAPGLADPAAVLAGLIDLRGGVTLAERLAELDGALPVVAASDPAAVRATLHAGLADLEGRLDEAFTQAFRPRYRLPTVHRAWLIIERSGLLSVRPGKRSRKAPKELRAAVRHLWAPFGEFLDTHSKRARFALRDLRVELGPQIAGLSGDAARLVQLDGALGEATHGATERLLRRVAWAAEQAFVEGVTAAWRGWPAEATVGDFAGGWSPEGWLGDRLAEATALYRAVVHHERARLEALVEAACALVEPR